MLYLTIAEFIKMNHDAATLIRCERLLAQAAFSILARENPQQTGNLLNRPPRPSVNCPRNYPRSWLNAVNKPCDK